MPDSRTVLPSPNLLDLIGIRSDANVITLAARTSSRLARCPACGKRSARVHSRYTRTLSDLPWQGIPVTVRLRVRTFFCEEANCHRVIFAERLPGLAAHYARRTERLDGWFTHVSFALGGEAGSRLLKDLGIFVSGETLLNHIRSKENRILREEREILKKAREAFSKPSSRRKTGLGEHVSAHRGGEGRSLCPHAIPHAWCLSQWLLRLEEQATVRESPLRRDAL
jgi:transposase